MLFPPEMITKTGGEEGSCYVLARRRIFFFGISRLDTFCEGIAPDDPDVCKGKKAEGQKRERLLSLLTDK